MLPLPWNVLPGALCGADPLFSFGRIPRPVALLQPLLMVGLWLRLQSSGVSCQPFLWELFLSCSCCLLQSWLDPGSGGSCPCGLPPGSLGPTGISGWRCSGFAVCSPELFDPRLGHGFLGCWGVLCFALAQGSRFPWELVFPVVLALCTVTGSLLCSWLRSSAFRTYGWADCQALGRIFLWIPWFFFFFFQKI